jgi:CubicO group peptidase (beta-lactamase class C family)
VVPGLGRYDPCDWGLGFELCDEKSPHWSGARRSPTSFGHFGQSGTFVLVDPSLALAIVVLTDRAFGPWAVQAWPVLIDAVLAEAAPSGHHRPPATG